jgi:DICT domain-containing protein
MKTLVITAGDTPLPSDLDEVITRGSTAVEHRRTSDLSRAAGTPDADRVVFWSSAPDAAIRQLAGRYARAEARARKEAIVFVTTTPGETVAGVSPTELFVWPQDKDRLTMAFMTGA